MTNSTATRIKNATTTIRYPRIRVTRGESQNRLNYDIYLYIPANFDSNDADEKNRINDFWNKGKRKLIPDDYKWSRQVKELHKYHHTLYSIFQMSLVIKANGENEIMIRLLDVKEYSTVLEYLKGLFPELGVEYSKTLYYQSKLFAGHIIWSFVLIFQTGGQCSYLLR